jgi:hypothetical protein
MIFLILAAVSKSAHRLEGFQRRTGDVAPACYISLPDFGGDNDTVFPFIRSDDAERPEHHLQTDRRGSCMGNHHLE